MPHRRARTCSSAVAITIVVFLAGCATDQPDTAATIKARPDNPWVEVVACLDEAGYPGFVAEESGIIAPPGSSDDDEQFALLLAAESACADQAGFYSGPIPVEELPRLHALEMDEVECLSDLGYELPEPAPSLQTYIDNTAQGRPWEAAFEVFNALPLTEQTEDLYTRLNTQCPPPASRFTKK